MFRNSFHRDVCIATVALLVVLLLCRLTAGAMGIVIIIVGVLAALMRRPWLVATCYLMIPVIQSFNRAIVGMGNLLFISGRFGGPCIVAASLVSLMAMGRRGRERLPIGWMWGYLAVACISSVGGWMPLVSFFKIAYFAIMLIGLVVMAKAIQFGERDVRMLRSIYMALALIMIVGSFITYFIPSVGYSMMIYKMEKFGLTLTGDDIVESTGMILFNGMTCHSQALAPVVISLGAWVMCDMLYVERRFSLLHIIILMFVPVLAYMSRSRGAFLMIVSVISVTWFFALPRASMSKSIRSRLKLAMTLGILLLMGAALYFELRNDSISRWLRKVEDVKGDQRSLTEAFTSSRQALVEMNLDDFKRNPLLGKGFQVTIWMTLASKSRDFNWFTASVEKGVTPYVILGETGIMGAIVFLVFLFVFYNACIRRRYMALMTCFTCFLVANLADSTFFSPSFIGGFMWVLSCIGGFSTDIIAKRMAMFPMMDQQGQLMLR